MTPRYPYRLIASVFFLFALAFTTLNLTGCNSSKETETGTGDTGETGTDPALANAKPLEVAGDLVRSTTGSSFARIPNDEAGIDFVNHWKPVGKHNEELTGSFISAGVAIGDYDQDGLPDVFLSSQQDGGRLYRNLGEFKFEDVTKSVGLDFGSMWGTGVTMVDINNDGWLDIYLCARGNPNRLYINEKGKFVDKSKEYGLNYDGASVMMSFSDVDKDGDLDAYLVTNRFGDATVEENVVLGADPAGGLPIVHPDYAEKFYVMAHPTKEYHIRPAGQFDHFYENVGGRFEETTTKVGIGREPYIGLAATWWDYNDDGWPDLYVSNDFMGPDHLYRNNGLDENGQVSFTDVLVETLPHTPWYSMGADYGDIDNDGRLDFLAADMAGTNHYRDKLSMGPMSGPDSQSWFLNWPDPPQYMRNALYYNTGTDRFMEVAFLTELAKTDWTWTVRFSDLDNDGWQDVFFTNGMSRDWFNGDLLDESKRLLADEGMDAASDFWRNQDRYDLQNLVFRNSGKIKFKDVSKKWKLDHVGVSTGAALGDLDGDGDMDIVINNFDEAPCVYRNDVAEGNSLVVQLQGVESNRLGVGAKVVIELADGSRQQTRCLSLARGFMSQSEPVVHFGLGDADSISKLTVHWPSGKQQEFENLEANKKYVVTENVSAEAESAAARSTAWFSKPRFSLDRIKINETDFDDFDRQPLLPNRYSQLGPSLAWGDVDGDGDDDFYVGRPAGEQSDLYLNQGDGTFQIAKSKIKDDVAIEDMGSLFFDADGDGDLDLYVVSGGVECDPGADSLRDRLLINDGNGNFELAPEGTLDIGSQSGGVVCAADFDRDGDLDLFVGGRIIPGRYPETPRSYILLNDGGKFADATDDVATGLAESGLVTSAVWSDVDSDGWVDLMISYEWGPVRYYQNQQGKFVDQTAASGLAGRKGWFYSIAAGDVDNDGDTDYFVGNHGLNSKYHPSDATPELLYYGDFEGNGVMRIVEGKYENGVCLPHRGLGCSSDAMPSIKERLPTYHEFAISPLTEIYTEESLKAAISLNANDLHHGVLINNQDENGATKFDFIELPNIAQASPVYGCEFCDINADGFLDLVAAQNFYGPQRETGYLDGGVGLVMLGDGSGNFEFISPSESEFVVVGGGKGLTITDFNGDGKIEIVVGINNVGVRAFENNLSDYVRVRVTKDGKAVPGSTIVFNFKDGTSQKHELTMGQGYLSQSSLGVFIPSGRFDQISGVEITLPSGEKVSKEGLTADGATLDIEL